MNWEEFIKNGKVIRGTPDKQQAIALRATSDRMLLAAKRNADTAADVSTAYSALRQLLEALTVEKGFRVYSHEAYAAYLKHLGHVGFGERFDRFRKIRNGIEYYGEDCESSVAKSLIHEMEILRSEIRRAMDK